MCVQWGVCSSWLCGPPRDHGGSWCVLPTDHHYHHHPHYHNLFLTRPAWELTARGRCHELLKRVALPLVLCMLYLWTVDWLVFSNTGCRILNLFSSIVCSSLFRITVKYYDISSFYFFMIKVFVQTQMPTIVLKVKDPTSFLFCFVLFL